MIDATTGKVVGHTTSTQSAVSEASMEDIQSWEDEYLSHSKNFKVAAETINAQLAQMKPGDPTFRVHPKFLRTLSGGPSGGALFLNTTFICPGDIGPNRILQPPDIYNAVFNRHKWDSTDVIFRNLTGRIDRNFIFTSPFASLINNFPGSKILLKLVGKKGVFREPSFCSVVHILAGDAVWEIPLKSCAIERCHTSAALAIRTYSIDIPFEATEGHTLSFYDTSVRLTDWIDFSIEQPVENPPDLVGIELIIRRDPFPFPVNQSWPPNRPDITANPKDHGLKWPAEEFRFATAVGINTGATQRDVPQPAAPTMNKVGERFLWKAPIDRVWTNPSQPSSGFRAAPEAALLDPLFSDVASL